MIWMILAVVIATDAPTSPEGRELIAAIEQSIAKARADNAALPPAKTDVERLQRLTELDQAPRRVVTTFDFGRIPEADRGAALNAASARIEAVDDENLAILLAMVPPEGWFLRSKYGKAARIAFHIVQHSDVQTQKRFLPTLETLVPAGEFDGQSYGMMFDRVAISEGRPQRFGTQFRCDGGKWRPYPMEAADQVDARRKAMGFPEVFAAYKAQFDTSPTCPQTRSAPPPGMKLD
jgi:hypothetical protein